MVDAVIGNQEDVGGTGRFYVNSDRGTGGPLGCVFIKRCSCQGAHEVPIPTYPPLVFYIQK